MLASEHGCIIVQICISQKIPKIGNIVSNQTSSGRKKRWVQRTESARGESRWMGIIVETDFYDDSLLNIWRLLTLVAYV